ncbi:MAG TPA: hypothetical protein VE078_03140 [Thermoanaerobaculia bacterium]|nr:hypothetical protein [Thermoanaerobaculia bacterium]
MTCPDWTVLTAHRRERGSLGAAEPESWPAALAHFDCGCQLCRKAALKADPTLVFRRLPPVPAARMTETEERAEVEAVRQAVAAMRTASRLGSDGHKSGALTGWRRWTAAAVLALAALFLPYGDARQARPAADQAAIFRNEYAFGEGAQQVEVGAPVMEGVNLPGARVYHMSGEGLQVVMVVDESIDI